MGHDRSYRASQKKLSIATQKRIGVFIDQWTSQDLLFVLTMVMMMVTMIQSAMMMIALHYNDSDKRDIPKIPRRSDDGNGDDGDGAQCNDDMMVMMMMKPIAQ